MKRKTRVIQIDGLRGLVMALFAVVCLAAGFVGFPGLVAMTIWNYFDILPPINLFQGILLWAIVAMSIYLLNGRKVLISFASPKELTDAEMDKLMERVRIQSQMRMLNSMMLKASDEKQKLNNNGSNNAEDENKISGEVHEEIKK